MDTKFPRELIKLEIKLFLDLNPAYPKVLRIPFIFCGERHIYEFSLISNSNSSTNIDIMFIYKSSFLSSESLKQRKNYLNTKIELGWFDLLPESLNYSHRIVFRSKLQQESLSKILCYTIQRMRFTFQTYFPVFLCNLETLTQSSIKSFFQNFKEMENNKSNDFYFEIKYPRKYKNFDPKQKNNFDPKQEKKIDSEYIQEKKFESENIQKEKTDSKPIQKKKIGRFSKDMMILEKFVENEELFRFFMPFTTIDFKSNLIKFPQFLANVRKVSIKEVFETTIIDKLRDINGLLSDISMQMDARIILDNLFRSKESHYFVLIKKPIFTYILDNSISLKQHSKSVRKVCNSFSFRFSSLEDHTFKAITKFALIEKDSNIIELPNQFIDRYLKFKSINSKNLITIHGLFQHDSSNYNIVTENFQIKSYYSHFLKIQNSAMIDNETRRSLLTEFVETISDLLDLIYICDIKILGFLDFSNEYLDFSSGVVKLIPSFKYQLRIEIMMFIANLK